MNKSTTLNIPLEQGVFLLNIDEAHSNTQDKTSSEKSNVIDLLTIFTKIPHARKKFKTSSRKM